MVDSSSIARRCPHDRVIFDEQSGEFICEREGTVVPRPVESGEGIPLIEIPRKEFAAMSRIAILERKLAKPRFKAGTQMLEPERLRSSTVKEKKMMEKQSEAIRKKVPTYKYKTLYYVPVAEQRKFAKYLETLPAGRGAIEIAEGRFRLVEPKFAGRKRQSRAEQLLEEYYRERR